MKRLHTIAEARDACRALRIARSTTLALVPTMGALHEGHLSLLRAAKATCDHVAVSIFVNPTQFGPNEDLDRYPRTLEADCALLENEKVDLVFAPSAQEMYPPGAPAITVDPGELGDRLDGRSRPGHFRGVATVVTKLFNVLQPDSSFFGQKDAAQVAVLRAVSPGLNLRTRIVVCPTVRDPDGLALSSRNRYLTAGQRQEALAIPQALACARRLIEEGERRTTALLAAVRHHLVGLTLDYAEVVHAGTLLRQESLDADSLLAVAAYLGETRLIDNLLAADVLPAVPR